jgi:predicted transcriptional regulator
VRITVDLPDDLHQLARQLAHDQNRSMSDVVADLIRLGLNRTAAPTSGRRGLPLVSIGRPLTAEDVRSLDDE